MALTNGTYWEIRSTATTGNTGGAGFNTANANFPTDATATSATGNSPVISSATYNFAAGDVGAWIYIKSGTNWTPGWYQIASVAANAATVSAAIGQAIQLNATTNLLQANTVAGVATTASPTGGTYGVDYSQQNAAQTTATDFTSVGASTTLTSATATFTPVMVGNIFHQTTTGTGAHGVTGWYEVVSYTNVTTVVLDRTSNDGTASVACTGFVGGAGIFNALEDAFLEMIPGASTVFIKNGTYTVSAAISIASTNSTNTAQSLLVGYNALRGDACTGSNRPTLAMGANAIGLGQSQNIRNVQMTGTAATLFTVGALSYVDSCKFVNSSSTAARNAGLIATNTPFWINCEFISQNGNGLGGASNTLNVIGGYFHDSTTGLSSTGSFNLVMCLFEACSTAAVATTATGGRQIAYSNTIYGVEGKVGIGFNLSGANAASGWIVNNIIYGCTTGVTVGTGPASNISRYNDYSNNTTDATNYYKDTTDLALNPTFTGATQITGTTATTSGSVLTQSGGDFSTVTDNVDYVRVTAGTGTTLGNYLITSHTTTTLTVNNALGTGASADKVYYVTTGHNFAIGTNLAGVGTPAFDGALTNIETTGYPDIGAVQRQGSSGTSHTFA